MSAARLSNRELFILGMAARGKTYGHRIARNIRSSRADLWLALSEKHLYYVLRKLERTGMLSVSEERVGNAPPRRVVEMTALGKQSLRETLLEPPDIDALSMSAFDPVFSMLAYASESLNADEAAEVLRKRRHQLARRLEEDYPDIPETAFVARFGPALRAMFEKGRALLVAELAWLDELLEQVGERGWDAMRVPEDFEAREEER